MLPKSKRLRTEAFNEIIKKGHSFHGPFLIVRAAQKEGSTRCAVSVPKKVAKLAVNRNKIRRQVYSIVEKLDVKPSFEIIIIMKIGSEKLNFLKLKDEVKEIFVKSRLLK
jgi:ribonuclease P protein component